VVEKNAGKEPTLLERWLQDQQEWQKTAMAYLDSMVKSEEFLTHLGNAMRGSLLAGKPYPSVAGGMPGGTEAAEERMDEVLHALHQIQGQLADLKLSVEELQRERSEVAAGAATMRKAAKAPKAAKAGKAARKAAKTAAIAAPKKKPAKKRRGRRNGDSA
jgi:hypothetical protein